jgi:hypothetical protein
VGPYAINQGTLSLNSNYDLAYTGANLVIGKKAISVTATAAAKTYGETDPALNYTFGSALVSGDAFEGALNRVSGEAVGPYAINQGTLSLNDNYDLTYTGANLAISKKLVAVTASAQTKTYGEADPGLTYTFAPALADDDNFTGSLARAEGEAAGIYTISQGTLSLNDNYDLTFTGADLVIGKKTSMVTITAQTKTYGDADPELTYTFTPALVSDDNFTGALARAEGEAAGVHTINQGTLSLSSNYDLTFTGADLVIGKKDIEITAVANTRVYGQADPALGYTFAPALISDDSFTGSLFRSAGRNVGVYDINIGSLSAGANYNVTAFTPAAFTITPAPLVITAEDKTKEQGTANPVFTFRYDGLTDGDGPSDLTSLPQAQTVAGNTSPIGYYDITAGGATSANYTISFATGRLTILPAGNHLKVWTSSSSVLQIRIYAETAQRSFINLYTDAGQPVISLQKQLQPGINSATMNVGSLAPGVYILNVGADNFKEAQRVKIK